MNQALGDTERFNQVAAEYEKASEVNGRRLYIETLEQVLPRIRKLFVDKNGNLDLTILGKGEPEHPRNEAEPQGSDRNCRADGGTRGVRRVEAGRIRRVAAVSVEPVAPQPQDAIYETLDAVREGDLPKYFAAHTGAC